MKLIFITMITCILVGCGSTSNKQSTEDLCAINLNKISNYAAYNATIMGEPTKTRVHELRSQAETYQQQGDTKGCITSSEQALEILGQYNSK